MILMFCLGVVIIVVDVVLLVAPGASDLRGNLLTVVLGFLVYCVVMLVWRGQENRQEYDLEEIERFEVDDLAVSIRRAARRDGLRTYYRAASIFT
jgi:K+ transporter